MASIVAAACSDVPKAIFKAVLFAALFTVQLSFSVDVYIPNEDVSVPSGSVFNYFFSAGGTGRLIMADNARPFGNVTLQRNAIIYSNGLLEPVRNDPEHGISNTQLDLGGYQLMVQSDLPPAQGSASPFF